MRRSIFSLSVLSITLLTQSDLFAQQGLTNRNGGNAASTVGGGQSLNEQNLFSSTGEESNFGALGTTQGADGNTRFQGSQFQNSTGFGGNTTGGSTRGSSRSFGGGSSRGGRTNFSGGFNSSQGFNPFGGNGTTSTRSIRPSLRLGFAPIRRSGLQVKAAADRRFASIQNRLKVLSSGRTIGNLAFAADEKGSITLKGVVNSDSDRRLIANVMRMEPGVRSVKNELTVKKVAAK